MKEASQIVSCLPQMENIPAINAGSSNVHINLHSVQKVDGGKGKWLKETMPNKKPLYEKNSSAHRKQHCEIFT